MYIEYYIFILNEYTFICSFIPYLYANKKSIFILKYVHIIFF